MQPLRRALVFVLLLGLTPGATELLEDGLHLLRSGHSAHQAEHKQGPEDHGTSSEHGCNGWFHACACHHSLPFAATLPGSNIAAARFGVPLLWPPVVESGPAGVRRALDRPPAA